MKHVQTIKKLAKCRGRRNRPFHKVEGPINPAGKIQVCHTLPFDPPVRANSSEQSCWQLVRGPNVICFIAGGSYLVRSHSGLGCRDDN